MKYGLLASVGIAAIGITGSAMAGNIVLTGHDNELHAGGALISGGSAPAVALGAEINFVKNGSSLQLLTFDAGSELTNFLTNNGIAFTNVNPGVSVTAAMFDPTKYSAFVVASVTSCGGCDNTPADIVNIAAQSTAIASFFNAGGGILGLSGAGDTAAYAYVPQAAANAGGSPPSTGFVQTAAGATLGLPAVNGNATHNYFSTPGTGGLSASYVATETNSGNVETIALANGTISCTASNSCSVTSNAPEPISLSLLGAGLFGLGVARRSRLSQR